jgi:antibiotic biosynthesis monooxygenase (ABM) superfamily enzyme
MSFNITPVMYEEANLDALYALSKKHITSTRFFHLLTVDNEEEYEPWLDLIDVVVAQGVAGFQQIESILRAHNPSAQSKSFTLIFRS